MVSGRINISPTDRNHVPSQGHTMRGLFTNIESLTRMLVQYSRLNFQAAHTHIQNEFRSAHEHRTSDAAQQWPPEARRGEQLHDLSTFDSHFALTV